jgi:hypothetical protein
MEYFAGFDVLLRSRALCIVDSKGTMPVVSSSAAYRLVLPSAYEVRGLLNIFGVRLPRAVKHGSFDGGAMTESGVWAV